MPGYGAHLFGAFYYYQPYLPWWISAALLWWCVQLAYRRRRVGRILAGPYHEQRLQQLLRNGAVSTEQVIDWARLREGRLQSNAIFMLRFSDQAKARQALQEVCQRGPAHLAELARQSLAWKASK